MAPHIDSSKLSMYYGSYRFQPVPLMTYAQEPLVDAGGTRIADRVTLSFNGTLVNLSGIGSGDAAAMIALRNGLINALSGDNRELRILHNINSTASSGTAIISNVFPKVGGLSFNEGTWNYTIGYAFDLTYETNLVSGAVPVEQYEDNWSFQEDASKRVIRISHDVSAVGINTSVSGNTSNAMYNAKTWVLARMGVSTIPSGLPGFADSGTLGDYELQKYRTESASATAGSYQASEEITMASGHYANSYTVQFQEDSDGIVTLTINGDVEGLGRFDAAIDHAVSGWNNRVQPALSGIAYAIYSELGGSGALNLDNQQSFSVTRDTYDGRIGYSVSYNDDPAEDLPSGVSELNISKQVKYPIRKVAIFEIPNRIQGSILHDIGTPTDGEITINGTVQGIPNTQVAYLKTVAEDELNALRPNAAAYQQLWLSDKSVTESEKQKSISFNLAWGFTDSLSNVQSASGDITL